MQPASEGLPRLFAYLDALAAGLARQPGPWGCLLQNSLMERAALGEGAQAVVDEFVVTLHSHILAILNAAQQQGQLAANENPRTLADFVTTHIQGMILMSRSGGDLDHSIAVLRNLLQR